jgi:hypothetical protein
MLGSIGIPMFGLGSDIWALVAFTLPAFFQHVSLRIYTRLNGRTQSYNQNEGPTSEIAFCQEKQKK